MQTYGIILTVKIVLYFHPHGSASWIQVVDGVKEITSHANWHVQEVNVRPTQKNLNELRAFWKPIGAIVDAGAGANKLSEADLESFPVVFIDHDPATLPANSFSVCHDSAATATLAAKELLSTGFEHFAYVPFPEKRFWDEEREAAFRKAVEINGMPCSVFRPAKTTGSDSVAHLRLLREFIAGLPRPCGVFAANDRTAEDVLTVARMLGLTDAITFVNGAYGRSRTSFTASGAPEVFATRFTSAMKFLLSGATRISRSSVATSVSHLRERTPRPFSSRQSTPVTLVTP